jgi:hypothetical protein
VDEVAARTVGAVVGDPVLLAHLRLVLAVGLLVVFLVEVVVVARPGAVVLGEGCQGSSQLRRPSQVLKRRSKLIDVATSSHLHVVEVDLDAAL